MSYALVGVTLEQSLLTEKSSIVGFNSIVGPVSEGLSTENIQFRFNSDSIHFRSPYTYVVNPILYVL
ncbi:hypothetical protein VN97_g2254 [Penicillium thymicola]|uniref:Uncharacterized protein n=1 Tax=Penicillium thymicola TaxID=293382 RepID=A0AAI9TQ78_PENTH|nr:hypothetical protein VN97_g2254 [Penicillium thymicola]